MLKNLFVFLSLLFVFGSTSCRSEFEKVRQSGNPKKILAQANQYYKEENYQKAQMLYELVISDYRGKPEAEEIIFRYAYTHFNMGLYYSAVHYFKNFANTFINSQYREEAEFMSAYSLYKQSPNYKLGQENTQKAIDQLQVFINTYPESTRVKESNRLIDELRAKLELKAFKEAKLYYDMRQYQSALHAFDNVLKDFPGTKNTEQIRYLAVKSSQLLADQSVYEKQSLRYEEAIDNAELFLRKHPKSKYKSKVKAILKHIKSQTKKLKS